MKWNKLILSDWSSRSRSFNSELGMKKKERKKERNETKRNGRSSEAERRSVYVYVPEAASTNSPLMKSLVNFISGTTTPAGAALPLPLQPLLAIDVCFWIRWLRDGRGDAQIDRLGTSVLWPLPLTRLVSDSSGERGVLELYPIDLGPLPLPVSISIYLSIYLYILFIT